MLKKQPAYKIFNFIGHKAIALISNTAKRSGWDQPLRGKRFYHATAMVKSIFLYYVKGMDSLADLEGYLHHNPQARLACGFKKYTPSRSTLSRFMKYLGYNPFEELFYQFVKLFQDNGMVTGGHLAIDSTHIKAWSKRKSKDKSDPDFKFAKNCDFARLGLTPKGFMPCYRVQTATVTHCEIPIAINIIPGNVHDRTAFEDIFNTALQQIPNPLAVSADKGYSSGKNRDLIQAANAACIIRPTKHEVAKRGVEHFIPDGMSEKTYWTVYWKRNSVERTFAQTKGHCGLERPRVVNMDPIKQHVFLSFITHQLLIMASTALGRSKVSFSLFF